MRTPKGGSAPLKPPCHTPFSYCMFFDIQPPCDAPFTCTRLCCVYLRKHLWQVRSNRKSVGDFFCDKKTCKAPLYPAHSTVVMNRSCHGKSRLGDRLHFHKKVYIFGLQPENEFLSISIQSTTRQRSFRPHYLRSGTKRW